MRLIENRTQYRAICLSLTLFPMQRNEKAAQKNQAGLDLAYAIHDSKMHGI